MILEMMGATCMVLAMWAVVLLRGLQMVIASLGLVGLAMLLVWIAVKRHERRDR